MGESASTFLHPWSNFYAMTGSSAAALTGLMFVVITLVTRVEQTQKRQDGLATFSTPTVLHFCAALFISAVLAAPWRSLIAVGIQVGLAGLYGVVYILRVMLRTSRLTAYTADAEDWAWYTILPLVAYVAILSGGISFPEFPQEALFVLAGGVVLLIFIGIRNSWDVVTYLAVGGPSEPPE